MATKRNIPHRTGLKSLAAGIGLMLAVSSLNSCGVYDHNDENCEPIVTIRFVYDMNMSGGDGFPAQVSSINLWVFDHETGRCVAEFADSGQELSNEGYTLSLTGLKGDMAYDFIAWGGLGEGASFSVPATIYGKYDLNCTMHTISLNNTLISNELLTPLFYGSLENVEFEDDFQEHYFTMYLMKDTNNINISLQHLSEETLDKNDFTIYMKDANGELDYDNSLMPDSREIIYYPWSIKSGEIDMPLNDLNYLQVEISTSRLMATHNPQIVIVYNETGETVYSIPIVDWAKKLRSMQNLTMDDQEYLDREHEYTVMLYLMDEGRGWTASSIIINGYRLQ